MNSKTKKILMIGLPILLCLCIAIPVLCILLLNNKTVSISYESSDIVKGSVSSENETVKVKKDAVGSTALANAGYTFVNWTKEGTEVSKEATFVPQKEGGKNVEATYVANFEANKYNATFVGNFEGSTYSTVVEQTYNTKYQLPEVNPERINYNFVGWFTEANGGTQITNESVFELASNATLYAHWSGIAVSVTFVGNFTGTDYSETIEQTYGLNYVLPAQDPEQDLFTIIGWFTGETDGEQITAESIVNITTDATLYAHWEAACVAEGTLVRMRDGSTKTVETIEIGDEIKTFDHENGVTSYSEVCFVWETLNAQNAFTLHFEEDVDVTVIEEHGFYDGSERKYSFINLENVNEFIGHEFYNVDTNKFLKLESVEIVDHPVNAYSIVTANHFNHLANGMLSMCDGIMTYVVNIFEYNEDMSFNKLDIQDSIEAFGLFEKTSFLEKYQGWSSEEFDDYNLEYLSIAIGKGFLTLEELECINAQCIAYNELQ